MTDKHGWPETLRLDASYRDEIVGYMQADCPDDASGVYRRADLPPTDAQVMTDDLLARLDKYCAPGRGDTSYSAVMCREAADRIRALQAELADGSFYKERDIDDLIARAEKAEALVKAEREACALVAENRHEIWGQGDGFHDGEGFPAVSCDVTACSNIAAAIRARSATEAAP